MTAGEGRDVAEQAQVPPPADGRPALPTVSRRTVVRWMRIYQGARAPLS